MIIFVKNLIFVNVWIWKLLWLSDLNMFFKILWFIEVLLFFGRYWVLRLCLNLSWRRLMFKRRFNMME